MKLFHRQAQIFAVVALVFGIGACANDPYQRTKVAAALGAAAGAAAGYAIDDGAKGALIGATLGALAGGTVGNYMDRQQQEFEQVLAAEQASHEIEIERLKDDVLKLDLSSEVSFDVGSAVVKTAFYSTLDKLSNVISKYDRTVVHVVGHTDSTGSTEFNQGLSERRSQSVMNYLRNHGVPADRTLWEGQGELDPRASNDSEAGRQLNRRVEIYLKPIVEGNERSAFESPVGR
ncbi:MAG: outer membrane protein OmpA-like peptidoglycan-associated protein [Gammaproteobacteria bacterium]